MDNILCTVYTITYNYLKRMYFDKDFMLVKDELDSIISQPRLLSCLDGVDYSYETIQQILSCINEKGISRKKNGVYYTPNDLVSFMVLNTVKFLYDKLSPKEIAKNKIKIDEIEDFCFNRTVFDPTCGAGEFLLEMLNKKIEVLKKNKKTISNKDVHKIVSTIYGNDINIESIKIAKVRILIAVLKQFGIGGIKGLSEVLSHQFMNYDYVGNTDANIDKYDILIGNPPYVEDVKYGSILNTHYGNVYANVLANAVNQLKENGIMCFVIPLSYVSTPRMRKIRNVLDSKISEQYILSYADRPDCLFTSVHQKLCILFGKAIQCSEKKIYTSNYKYWYKEEREQLFIKKSIVVRNTFVHEDFIPKVGNKFDVRILQKILKQQNKISDILDNGNTPLYLNMRATFWIKVFTKKHSGGEYKKFNCANDSMARYCICLLNSSLFWWFWVCISDCWHITNKELSSFRCPILSDMGKVAVLAETLEKKLENTKQHVATKQTEYEYKHKACINEIQAIDDYVCSLYGLNEEETEYIKEFAYIYRVSGGASK